MFYGKYPRKNALSPPPFSLSTACYELFDVTIGCLSDTNQPHQWPVVSYGMVVQQRLYTRLTIDPGTIIVIKVWFNLFFIFNVAIFQ